LGVAKLDQNWIKKMELVQAGGKGKVAIYNRDGLYWLRWSYRARRYSLAGGALADQAYTGLGRQD
jgi:hypothetical protein